MSNFSVKDIRGVIPAMVTPFDENEALDLARTRALTAKLIEDGARHQEQIRQKRAAQGHEPRERRDCHRAKRKNRRA